MLQLISAGIIRDGGSIAMEYRNEDGSLVSVLLEINNYSDNEPRTFGHLHVGSEIQNTCDLSTVIAKGSEREAALTRDIDELRRTSHPGARDQSMHWLDELRHSIPARKG